MDGTEQVIVDFRSSWQFVRGLTRDFVEQTPQDRYAFSPHARFGSMDRQFRHVLQVTDLYTDALRSRVLSMPTKFARYGGSLDRDDLLAGLARADAELSAVVDELGAEAAAANYQFGDTAMGIGELFDVFIEHEANHHGLWSAYAAVGGWSTPESWRDAWDL